MTDPRTTENELRDLLARVVPDAPGAVGDAGPLVTTGRSRRRRRRTGMAVAACLVVAAGVAVPMALRGSNSEAGPVVAEDTTSTVFTDAPCPAATPVVGNALPDLGEVSSIRLCSWPLEDGQGVAAPVAADALIGGVDDLGTAIAKQPTADPMRCAAISMLQQSVTTLQLSLPTGTVDVAASFCSDVTYGGRTLDGGDVLQAYLDALDQQRDRLSYTQTVDAPFVCGSAATLAPARPGRETFVAAASCSADPDATPVPLSADASSGLGTAWSAAVGPPPSGDECAGPDQGQALARTDRGDLVVLPAHCGYLTDEAPWSAVNGWKIDVALS